MVWIIRRLLLPAIALLVIAAGVAYLLFAHRVDRPSLSYSIANGVVSRRADRSLVADCEPGRHGGWVCSLQATDGNAAGIVYFMTTRGDCWTARLSVNTSGYRLPDHATGCVGILDQLRVSDRIRGILGSFGSSGSSGSQAGYF